MREIKFRVFFYDGLDKSSGGMITMLEAYNLNYVEFSPERGLIPVDECSIIMQYTGLKDKNGVEIYEGDIVKISKGHSSRINKPLEVVFDLTAFCIVFKDVDYKSRFYPTSFNTYRDHCINNGLSEDVFRYVEVIGNIHENKELL